MIILGFETANFGASLSLIRGTQVLETKCFSQTHGHAGFLISEIQSLLEGQAISWGDIGAFVTTTGPGSFTGVRLALAVARTLGMLSKAPVLGVPSPLWYAKSFMSKSLTPSVPLLVCLEARRQDLYCQLFDPTGAPLREVVNRPPEGIPDYVKEGFPGQSPVGQIVAIGNGITRLENLQDKSLIFEATIPTAEDLCFLAREILEAGQGHTYPLTPLYVRPPDISLPKLK